MLSEPNRVEYKSHAYNYSIVYVSLSPSIPIARSINVHSIKHNRAEGHPLCSLRYSTIFGETRLSSPPPYRADRIRSDPPISSHPTRNSCRACTRPFGSSMVFALTEEHNTLNPCALCIVSLSPNPVQSSVSHRHSLFGRAEK